jgi:hypothetical protein
MSLRTRLALIHHCSDLIELTEHHGTLGQVEFYLRSRGRDLGKVRLRHDAAARAKDTILAAAPSEWAVAIIERTDLPRFLTQPEDRIVVVGQTDAVPPAVSIGREAQASSGVVVGTGTGATGRCASLAQDRGRRAMPSWTEPRLARFVREAWPSPSTRLPLAFHWACLYRRTDRPWSATHPDRAIGSSGGVQGRD